MRSAGILEELVLSIMKSLAAQRQQLAVVVVVLDVVLLVVICKTPAHPVISAADDDSIMQLGSSLRPTSPPLVSPSSIFKLSFRPFSPATSSSLIYLAISFSASGPDSHPVWVANRNNPVSSSAILTLSSSGDLLLSDSTSTIWSSGTSGMGVLSVQLLDTGNLVLLNISSNNNSTSDQSFAWQSFLNPTDTLLPGQRFSPGMTLFSAKSTGDFSSEHRFSLRFDDSSADLQLRYLFAEYTFQEVYWHWPALRISNNRSDFFFQMDDQGNMSLYNSASSINGSLVSSDYSSSPSAAVPGNQQLRRLTLDVDGNLRQYTWNQSMGGWIPGWMAISDICYTVPLLCGDYGICVYEPHATCVCPQGFSVVDPKDLSSGCRPNYQINTCSGQFKYMGLGAVNYPYNDINNSYLSLLSEEDCKQRCSQDCNCMAIVYQPGGGNCWLKSQVQYGYAPALSGYIHTFLKISDSDPSISPLVVENAVIWSNESLWRPGSQLVSSNQSTICQLQPANQPIAHDSNHTVLMLFKVVLAAVVGLLVSFFMAGIICLVATHRRRIIQIKQLLREAGTCTIFSYEELKAATDNFKEMLGQGSFGEVFKGKISDGEWVAVKRLKSGRNADDDQERETFKAEIRTLGRAHHINLVGLRGFCSEKNHMLLVYEYMENKSLDKCIRLRGNEVDMDTEPNGVAVEGGGLTDTANILNTWSKRLHICLDVAKGLTYLHEDCLRCILHCDIKPPNILLDSSYRAKVADFGLAHLFSGDHMTTRLSTARGTLPYMAPEWFDSADSSGGSTVKLSVTAKADVFSYGKLLMVIVSGRKLSLIDSGAVVLADRRNDQALLHEQELLYQNNNNNYNWSPLQGTTTVVDWFDPRMDASPINFTQAEAVLRLAFDCIKSNAHARPSMRQVVERLEEILLLQGSHEF